MLDNFKDKLTAHFEDENALKKKIYEIDEKTETSNLNIANKLLELDQLKHFDEHHRRDNLKEEVEGLEKICKSLK